MWRACVLRERERTTFVIDRTWIQCSHWAGKYNRTPPPRDWWRDAHGQKPSFYFTTNDSNHLERSICFPHNKIWRAAVAIAHSMTVQQMECQSCTRHSWLTVVIHSHCQTIQLVSITFAFNSMWLRAKSKDIDSLSRYLWLNLWLIANCFRICIKMDFYFEFCL